MPNSSHATPEKSSQNLLYEFGQLNLSTQQGFYAQLEHETLERDDEYRQALATAAAEHERVRQSVELERQLLEARIRAEQDRREFLAREELERQRHETIQRDIEEKERHVRRIKAAEEERRRLEAVGNEERLLAAKVAQQRANEAEEAKRREEEDKRAAAEQPSRVVRADPDDIQQRANAALQRQNAQKDSISQASAASSQQPLLVKAVANGAHPIQARPSGPSPTKSEDPVAEARHESYLRIHSELKQLRCFVLDHGKTDRAFKDRLGDMRRSIIKSVGQMTGDKEKRRQPTQTILNTLRQGSSISEPQTDISRFISNTNITSPTPSPAVLIYLLNIFSKAVISQFLNEASVAPATADPIGIIATHVFALPDFQFQLPHNGMSASLIDILIAKFHRVCPIVFGIWGPETTVAGKNRIGWWREENPSGPFVSQQRHFERMTGLGAGFAALSLRNYERTRMTNPFPNRHYWESLARMANAPSHELTQTHFVVLKAMIDGHEDKFIAVYGGAAVAALRLVLVELPKKVVDGAAVKALAGFVDVLAKDRHLIL